MVIGCGQPELIPFYAKETDCSFPIYADPTGKLYDLLGMTRTLSLGYKAPEYVQTSLLTVVLKSFYQVLRSGQNALKGGDFDQVGGEFMFNDGKVTWCHRMQNTRDHAEIPILRKVLDLDDDRPPMRKRWSMGVGRALSNRRHSWSRSRSGTRKGSPPASAMKKVVEEKDRNGINGDMPLNDADRGISTGQPTVQAAA